jgi:hypothetical protein
MKRNLYYYDYSLEGETFEGSKFNEFEFGVFKENDQKEGHCYFYGSEEECKEYCDRHNSL